MCLQVSDGRCPLRVKKQTFAVQNGMSALPPKADIGRSLSKLWLCPTLSRHIPIPGVVAPAKSLHSPALYNSPMFMVVVQTYASRTSRHDDAISPNHPGNLPKR